MRFEGFPERALDFYEGLEADNSRPYWTDHKAVYDACIKAPMEALLAELESEFGPGKLFRPYRDVRFSKDKTLYKTAAGATAGGLYVQLSAAGLFAAGGLWQTTTDQARRLRAAVADDRSGTALEQLLERLHRDGLRWDGDRLKRIPKEHADCPREELVVLKTLTGSRAWEPEPWLHTREALDRVASTWRALGPLRAWLDEHVGPPRETRQR